MRCGERARRDGQGRLRVLLLLENEHAQEECEDNDAASQHLEDTGRGVSEHNISVAVKNSKIGSAQQSNARKSSSKKVQTCGDYQQAISVGA